jgi:hypothetical protein
MVEKQKECRVMSVKGRGIFPATPDPRPTGSFRIQSFGFRIFISRRLGVTNFAVKVIFPADKSVTYDSISEDRLNGLST